MQSLLRACLVVVACVAAPAMVLAQELTADASEHVLLISTPAAAVSAAAEEPASRDIGPAGPAPTPEHTGIKALFKDVYDDVKHLPSLPNLYIAGIGGLAAVGAHQADNHVNQDLMNASWSHSVFKYGAVLGQSPTLFAASAGVYAIGRFTDDKKVSHVGMDMIQSLMVSEMLVQGVKYSVRRERPDLSGNNSFPSGHSADTFAVATALERHFDWKLWVPAYAFASYVAASRLHDNVHYFSDVVFGSAVGIIAGRTVTRPGHASPIQVAALPGGAAVMYVYRGE